MILRNLPSGEADLTIYGYFVCVKRSAAIKQIIQIRSILLGSVTHTINTVPCNS